MAVKFHPGHCPRILCGTLTNKDRLELLSELVAEYAVQYRVGCAVHVPHGSDKHQEGPRLVKGSVRERVIEQQHLVRGIAREVDDIIGHQHLDYALSLSHGVRFPVLTCNPSIIAAFFPAKTFLYIICL